MRSRQVLASGWYVKQLENDRPDIVALMQESAAPDATWLPAEMPAQMHDVLFAHGLIGDPHIGKNAAAQTWVGERDWAYLCRFASPEKSAGPVLLRFGGLDTLATAHLNGAKIGAFDDMFREYAIDISEQLAPAGEENVLLLIFSSAVRFVESVVQPPEQVGKIAKCKYLRKATDDFTSYLGARPHFITAGIFRDVMLDVLDRGWIDDLCVHSELTPDLTRATLQVQAELGGSGGALSWKLVDPGGREVAAGESPIGTNSFEIIVNNPQLWWPRTHGAPRLYRLEAELSKDGKLFDKRTINIGLRDIKLIENDPAGGEKRFRFEINGQPIFLQGACWAPVEGMTHCWQKERARKLLDLAEQGRMNLIRVWGGGVEPPAEFYDECDRRGILVWQDFMFEWGMYPSGEPHFDDNCRREAEGMVRRLRNHPCLLLWAGGNENHMGWRFDLGGEPTVGRALFEEILAEVCARLDPTRPYRISSPFGGPEPNWPLEGDWHDYSTLTFCHNASVPTFVSELGRVSAMSVKNMRRFMSEEELWPAGHNPAIRQPGQPAWPSMWGYRSADGAWEKVAALEEFCEPSSAEELVRVLGTAHGEYLQRSVERFRRGVPNGAPAGPRRCWGNMIWRLNDPWPISYWSAIDYYLEPKIAYYFLRRTYAPVLVCFEQTPDRIAVWIVNDSPQPATGMLRVARLRFDGALRGELQADVALAPGEARRCLDTVELGPISLREEFLLATFADQYATHLLKGERYLRLPQARLQAEMISGGISISTDAFARQVALEMENVSGAVFADNFFDLPPGQTRTIALLDSAGGKRLRIGALNASQVAIEL